MQYRNKCLKFLLAAILAIMDVLVPLKFKSLVYHINNKVTELIPSVSPQGGPIFSEGQNKGINYIA